MRIAVLKTYPPFGVTSPPPHTGAIPPHVPRTQLKAFCLLGLALRYCGGFNLDQKFGKSQARHAQQCAGGPTIGFG